MHSPGLLPLAQVWREARRIEVGLKDAKRGQTHPVVKWLRQTRRVEHEAEGVANLLYQLRRLVMISSQRQVKILKPAFITGAV